MFDHGNPIEPLFSAEFGDCKFMVSRVQDFGLPILGDVTRLSDEQVAKHPALLNRFDSQKAWFSNVLLAIAIRNGKIIAAVIGELYETGKSAALELCNLVSDSSQKGVAKPLLAALYRGALACAGCAPSIRAYARVMPDGRANVASTKTLMRMGVYAAELVTHPVTFRNPQKALGESLEPDGQELRYFLLIGDPADVTERVNFILR